MADRTNTDSLEPAGFDTFITWEIFKDFLGLIHDYTQCDECRSVSVPLLSSDNGELVLYTDLKVPCNDYVLTGLEQYGNWMSYLREVMNSIGREEPDGTIHQVAAFCYMCNGHVMHDFWSFIGIQNDDLIEAFTIPDHLGVRDYEEYACKEYEKLTRGERELVIVYFFELLREFLEEGHTR